MSIKAKRFSASYDVSVRNSSTKIWHQLTNRYHLSVSIEPFLFNVLELGSIPDFASQVYAGDLGAMMAILGSFTLVLADEERKLIPKDLIREYKIESTSMFVAAAFFLISIAVPFQYIGPRGLPWRFYLWIIPFAISGIERRLRSVIGEIRKHQKKRSPQEVNDESIPD